MRLKNSQSVGLKLPKCREAHALIPLFIGVFVKVIEHITDDVYNRQGKFMGLSGWFTVGKRKTIGKKEQSKTNQRAVGLGTVFYGVYTNVYKRFVFYWNIAIFVLNLKANRYGSIISKRIP